MRLTLVDINAAIIRAADDLKSAPTNVRPFNFLTPFINSNTNQQFLYVAIFIWGFSSSSHGDKCHADILPCHADIFLRQKIKTCQRSIKCKQRIKNKEMIFRSKLAACTIHRK